MVYTINTSQSKNKAEDYIEGFFLNNEMEKITTFHGVNVEGKRVSLIIMSSSGIVVIEVRPYFISQITDVKKGGAIYFNNRPPEFSPMNIAIEGMSNIVKMISEKKIQFPIERVTAAVCYPFISNIEYEKSELKKVSIPELTLLKDDFESENNIISKLCKIFDFVADSQNITKSIDIIDDIQDEISCLLISDFYKQKKKYGDNRNILVDFNVNSMKDLFYEICSFLMKNEIVAGNIYSESKSILDGLGDYMTAVRIPWFYDIKEERKVGYCLKDGVAPQWDRNTSISIIGNKKKGVLVRGIGKQYKIDIHDDTDIMEDDTLFDFKEPIHLKNEQIRKMFLRAFVVAEDEIDIISPWMNFGVVTESFEGLMENALKKGVKIKIIYGLKSNSYEYNLSRSNRSDEVANHLIEVFSRYGEQLFIKRDNIHYKLVLCDEKFKLEGGYNYLSFVGDYSKEDTRKEGSPFGTNIEEIKYLREEYFSNVK